MVCQKEHIDQPMSLLDSKLRQGGRYGHYYFDLDRTSSTVFRTFHRCGQQPQTYKAKGPERAAGLSLWLYPMVWFWYLKQRPRRRYFIVRRWYRQKLTPSFADALSCLRRELWRERIKCMFGISAVNDKKFEFLLEALAPAA